MSSCNISFKKSVNSENLEGEYINRSGNEQDARATLPIKNDLPEYPWSHKKTNGIPKITKDFFRCKGNPTNSLIQKESICLTDCEGGQNHGLPMRMGKEFIYPCLIELLNYIQEKTKKKVIITTGFRCPTHNAYSDPSSVNKTSKHMCGAEVDFYVEGMEYEPEKVIGLLQNFYKKESSIPRNEEYTNFQKLDPSKHNVSIAPWANKEILIKLNLENENRDFDNSHAYPYITLQVRYDRELDKKVSFDEKICHSFLRK